MEREFSGLFLDARRRAVTKVASDPSVRIRALQEAMDQLSREYGISPALQDQEKLWMLLNMAGPTMAGELADQLVKQNEVHLKFNDSCRGIASDLNECIQRFQLLSQVLGVEIPIDTARMEQQAKELEFATKEPYQQLGGLDRDELLRIWEQGMSLVDEAYERIQDGELERMLQEVRL